MKYVVEIAEEGSGVCDTPEHFFGRKTLYKEVFDKLGDAKKATCEKVKELYNKYELCRKWNVVSRRFPCWIVTDIGSEDEWDHRYEATIYDFTDQEWEELAK